MLKGSLRPNAGSDGGEKNARNCFLKDYLSVFTSYIQMTAGYKFYAHDTSTLAVGRRLFGPPRVRCFRSACPSLMFCVVRSFPSRGSVWPLREKLCIAEFPIARFRGILALWQKFSDGLSTQVPPDVPSCVHVTEQKIRPMVREVLFEKSHHIGSINGT